jgi:hypothetical protein
VAIAATQATQQAGVVAAATVQPAASAGTGHDRALLDGVTIDRPFEAIPTILTNVVEHITGTRDERTGRALSQVGSAASQFIQAGLRLAARGEGVIAAGSSLLGKILPLAGVAAGVAQVWKGWNELDSHADGLLSVIHSRTARTGLLDIAASAMLFIPGIGSAIGGAVLHLGAAANEMDMFHALDWSTQRVEAQGSAVAEKVHVLDATPTVTYDRDGVSAHHAVVANVRSAHAASESAEAA